MDVKGILSSLVSGEGSVEGFKVVENMCISFSIKTILIITAFVSILSLCDQSTAIFHSVPHLFCSSDLPFRFQQLIVIQEDLVVPVTCIIHLHTGHIIMVQVARTDK
jgi:hypothetical protein